MLELKTRQHPPDVVEFLNAIKDEQLKADSLALLDLFTEVTSQPAKIWAKNIVGFGSYHYKAKHEGDWFLTGFSPKKKNLTLYILPDFKHYQDLLVGLGKYEISTCCMYIDKLADVNIDQLKDLIRTSVEWMKKKHA